ATVPFVFYIQPDGTPGDIHIFNTDAHRNYVGYRFDGTATAVELKNCRAYANRTYGLMDNTGAVTYSYCHLYANNLATGISTDVTGPPIDGGNNVSADTPPGIRGFMQYPARITLTYDDPGLIMDRISTFNRSYPHSRHRTRLLVSLWLRATTYLPNWFRLFSHGLMLGGTCT